ncbi:peptidase C39 family protein [Candidatus Woesearchaeota archaeon]|nr:peptidase C39 family protein [Candidatus Woesearchaeota archaeon]
MQSYTQTTEYTTAASSLMAVINHFKPDFKLTRENEFLIWHSTANLPVRASSIYALAVFAKQQGLSPSIVLGEKEYDYPDYRFKGYTKKEIDEAKFSSKLFHKKAMHLKIPVDEREFDFKEVRKLIKLGKVLMLRLNEGALRESGSTSKYVVIFEYNASKKEFSVMDPKQGIINPSEELLKQAFETLETKKKRDHRMMVF